MMTAFKSFIYLGLVFSLICTLISCSSNPSNVEKKEEGLVEQFTDETAQRIVGHIQTPLEAARNAAALSNKDSARVEGMTEGIEE